jgi:hypothetical protein
MHDERVIQDTTNHLRCMFFSGLVSLFDKYSALGVLHKQNFQSWNIIHEEGRGLSTWHQGYICMYLRRLHNVRNILYPDRVAYEIKCYRHEGSHVVIQINGQEVCKQRLCDSDDNTDKR